jgi:hypothetical protein
VTIQHTTNYGLAYCDDGTALKDLAEVTRQVAVTVDAAMGRAGYTPTDATTFAALAARVAALEANSAAPVAVPFVDLAGTATGWTNYGSWQSWRVWREGSTVFSSGLVKAGANVGSGATVNVGRIPAGFRPPVQEFSDTIAGDALTGRWNIGADGLVSYRNGAATTLAAAAYVPTVMHWSLR